MRPGTIVRWRALSPLLRRETFAGSRVLDVGGYDGNISHRLVQVVPGCQIWIIDLDIGGLLEARDKGLRAVCGSALDLPIEKEVFDLILCLDLLEHLEMPELVLREIHQALKSGGKLLLTTPAIEGVRFPLLSRKRNEAINLSWGHSRLGFSKNDIDAMLTNNGFSTISYSRYFNSLSRFMYRFSFLSIFQSHFTKNIFNLITFLEPYFKVGGHEHIFLAVKNPSNNQ